MEARFLPSLQKDGRLPKRDNPNRLDGCRQLAFIINGRAREVQKLVKNNLLEDSLSLEVVKKLYNFSKRPEFLEIFKKNRRTGEDERIAYLLFGLPANMIEGVFVGRLYEKDRKMLKFIKQVLPKCYICNLDGKVIVGNK